MLPFPDPTMRNKAPPDNSPAKVLFGLYQCLHHLSILAGNAETGKDKPFSRKAAELDRFFRPALPDRHVFDQIKKANLEWAQKQRENLSAHYRWKVDSLLGCISAWRLTKSDLRQHLNMTKTWAQKNFGRKFKTSVFNDVDKMVQNFTISEHTAKESAPSQEQRSSSSSQNLPKKSVTGTTSTPSRKRGRPSSADSPPGQTQKRSCTANVNGSKSPPSRPHSAAMATYADTTKSPPSRPKNVTKRIPHSTVTRFPRLTKDQRGSRIHSAWEIPKVVKDILILGTSNLSRIPFVNRRDAQICSYPGLKLAEMHKLLCGFKFGPGSTDPGMKLKHVVFSVGLNDRSCAASTNEVNLKKVLNEAKRQFPGSKISFYQAPFDERLHQKEIDTVRTFNGAMQTICDKEGMLCIPKVPRNKFATERHDPIHWTGDCALATLDHIFDHLN